MRRKGKRHLTPDEIKEQLKHIAREKRMCDRTPWSAMSIMCSYVIMRKEGFKGQRIAKITSKVNEYEEMFDNGRLTVEEVSKQLMDKADWTIEYTNYTADEITAKKGTYQYFVDAVQIDPMNAINTQATRYILFFFKALMEEYGFGKERLTRVQNYINELLELHRTDRETVHDWKKELFDEAGIVIEMPIDPLYQTKGSILTGI